MTPLPSSFHTFFVAAYTIIGVVYVGYVVSLVVRSRRVKDRMRALRS